MTTRPASSRERDRSLALPLRLFLAFSTVIAIACCWLWLGTGAAKAADAGPGYSKDDTAASFIGALTFDRQNAYCIQLTVESPIGAPTRKLRTDEATPQVVASLDPLTLAQLNWAISTTGRSSDPRDTAATALFVWETADPEHYRGDQHYLGFLPVEVRDAVAERLDAIRSGARDVKVSKPRSNISTSLSVSDAGVPVLSVGNVPAGMVVDVALTGATVDGEPTLQLGSGSSHEVPLAAKKDAKEVRADVSVKSAEHHWAPSVQVLVTEGRQLLIQSATGFGTTQDLVVSLSPKVTPGLASTSKPKASPTPSATLGSSSRPQVSPSPSATPSATPKPAPTRTTVPKDTPAPAAKPKQTTAPVATPTTAPTPKPAESTAPRSKPRETPAPEPTPDTTPSPKPEQIAKPEPVPTTESAPEPEAVIEPEPEPITEPDAEPHSEPESETDTSSNAESSDEATAKPAPQTASPADTQSTPQASPAPSVTPTKPSEPHPSTDLVTPAPDSETTAATPTETMAPDELAQTGANPLAWLIPAGFGITCVGAGGWLLSRSVQRRKERADTW
ncbi:hypothetical protein [Gulosibacter molinativorax]|uniref:Uncharacterized protein n=1 Tax=Gulosibacter molinativorax TaxID=256821 RepID=A0ABT7C9W5_9MICO|nr:hypothetical protein [Gulosibacter molinativorax]MDJ1372006.1 hypothetical protein [Gulosibacter molinativorax]QUY60751.1 Hypotetical protein [Gulosibacter molinativorax]